MSDYPPERPDDPDDLRREVEEKIGDLEKRLADVERQLAERARRVREGRAWTDDEGADLPPGKPDPLAD